MRWALLGLLVALGAGCGPKDPLDMKVSARNPDDYAAWLDSKQSRFTEEMVKDFAFAISVIKESTPRGDSRSPNPMVRDGSAEICRKIDGRTVRQVILDGYYIANLTMQRTMSNELENLQRNIKRSQEPGLGEKELRRFESTIKYQQEMVERTKTQLEINQKKVERLTVATVGK
jgi:hypothetical protein